MYFLNGAVHLGENLVILKGIPKLVKLRLLYRAVILPGLYLKLHGLYLHGVLELVVLAGLLLLLLKLGLIVVKDRQLVGNTLQLQLRLTYGQIHLPGVIAEKRLSGGDHVPLMDQHL